MKYKSYIKNFENKKGLNYITKDQNKYFDSLLKLEILTRSNRYSGYDPYDALNCLTLNNLNIKTLNIIFTQSLVYSPINIRPFLNIPKGRNPKAIGL